MEKKLNDVKTCLLVDMVSCDIGISIFMSAASSFKRNSLLIPFPKSYLKDLNEKDFEKLLADLVKIPDVEELILLILNGNITKVIDEDTICLLNLIIMQPKYSLKTVLRKDHDNILRLAKNSVGKVKPTHIFEVTFNRESSAEAKFLKLKKTFGNLSEYAYHGYYKDIHLTFSRCSSQSLRTKFSQVHSILNSGLQQHLNQTSLFGEGLYFATSIDTSLLFSPQNAGWKKSKCGENLSCVLLCEFVDDEKGVKRRKENSKNSEIPETYLLISNNELVKVRYLLVYRGSGSGSKKTLTLPTEVANGSELQTKALTFILWCRKNPFIVSLGFYLLFLILVGVSKTRAAEYYKKIVTDFLKRVKFS